MANPISNLVGSWGKPTWGGDKPINLSGGSKKWSPKGDRFSEAAFRQRVSNFFRKFGDAVCLGMALRFSVAAAKFTPPKNRGKWTGTIEDSLYFRPIQDLRLLAKGMYPRYYASKKDYQMLRAGYFFRVVNTKYRHSRNDVVVGYARGINEAKRMSRIQNRGLSKYSWGQLFEGMTQTQIKDVEVGKNDVGKAGAGNAVGVYKVNKLPPIFQRLAKKSPNITKYHWGHYDWKYKPGKQDPKTIEFTASNKLTQIERYGRIAVDQGLKAAVKYATKVWSAVGQIAAYRGVGPHEDLGNVSEQRKNVQNLRKMLVKLFDEDVKKYDIQQLYLERSYKGQTISSNHQMNDISVTMKG